MANESFSISEVIPARPERIYAAWMNSDEHSAFTGDAASVDAVPGGPHSAFGGYAQGVNIELQEGRRIVQSWRTTQFPSDSPDSRLEVTLEETVGGTMLTIFHSDIPPGQSNSYRQGWEKYYLEALKRYFNSSAEGAAVAEAEITLTDLPVMTAAKPARKSGAKAKAKAATSRMAGKVAKKRGGKAARKPAKKAVRAAARRPAKKPVRAAARRAAGKAATKKPGKARAKPAAAAKRKQKSGKPARRPAKKRR
jgi:uncharacterized protein YndB with AHSA1/START domain